MVGGVSTPGARQEELHRLRLARSCLILNFIGHLHAAQRVELLSFDTQPGS